MQLSKKKLGHMRANLLEIMPEITAIFDDITSADKMKLKTRDENGNKLEVDKEAAVETGTSVLKEYIDILLVRRYEGIIKILSVIYEIEPAEMEEKELEEIVGMIDETLQDKVLWRFFPSLRRWAQKTQSDM